MAICGQYFFGSLRLKISDPKGDNLLLLIVFDIGADWPKNVLINIIYY